MIVYKDIIGKLKAAGYNSGQIMYRKLLPQTTMDALRHNKPITLRSVDTICSLLKCQPGDILEYIENEPEE